MSVTDLFYPLVAALVLVFAPPRVRCPGEWYHLGAQRDGSVTCVSPLPRCCGDAKGECAEISCPEQRSLRLRVRCTGGTMPIVVDDQTVACQRGPSR